MPFWYQTKSPAVSDWSKAGRMRCILVWIWVLLDQGEHHCLDVHPCIGPCPGEVAHCCFGSALGCAVKGMKPTPAPLAWCGVAGGAAVWGWPCGLGTCPSSLQHWEVGKELRSCWAVRSNSAFTFPPCLTAAWEIKMHWEQS